MSTTSCVPHKRPKASSPQTQTKKQRITVSAQIDFNVNHQLLVAYYGQHFCQIFVARSEGKHNKTWTLSDRAYACCKNYNHTITWCQYLACNKVSKKEKQHLLFLMSSVVVIPMTAKEKSEKVDALRRKNGGKVLSPPFTPRP